MGFDRSSVDEREQAQLVADHIGSDHHSVLIGPEEIRAEIENGAWVFDDLFADWGTISTRLLYRRCRAMGIKVVLVGEGADELFGGYGVFQVPARLGLLEQFRLYRRYAGRRYGNLFGEFHEVMAAYLRSGAADSFHAVQLFESRRQLPNNYVMKVDKASMAESVEARAPYLDRRIPEPAYSYPRKELLDQDENKKILRTASRREGLLPSSISNRRKFGAPLATSWMDDDVSFRAFARDQILRPGSQTEQLGLRRVMESYFLHHKAGQRWPGAISVFSQLAWRLLLLELWAPSYLQQSAALP
jgi:asparagine synthase (glutamine-hydrolysing)